MNPTHPPWLSMLHEFLEPLSYEFVFAGIVIVGWLLVSRRGSGGGKAALGRSAPRQEELPQDSRVAEEVNRVAEAINEAFSDGRKRDVIAAWHQAQADVPMEPESLRMVVWSMAADCPSCLVAEVSQHLRLHSSICNVRSAAAVMDGLYIAGRPDLMEEMLAAFRSDLRIQPNFQVYESLLGGHAGAGDVERVRALVDELRRIGQKLTARGHALIMKGFLQHNLLDPALQQVRAMRLQGFYVPQFALAQLFRVASQAGRCPEIFAILQSAEVPLPAEALEALLDDCAKRADAELASRVEALLRAAAGPRVMSHSSYGALLKAKVACADVSALDMFEEVQRLEVPFGDAFYVALVAQCAEPKFLRFADEITRVLRARKGMTVQTYSALMKVYAHCGLYGKACDLYDEFMELGLEPDSVITTCVMRFAMEAERPEMLRKLSEKQPQSIQGYMFRIRAAGKQKDVDGAFAILQKMKAAGIEVDGMACNCVLDACVCGGDMERARGLLSEMRATGFLSIISFNTMLKGYCGRGDMKGTQQLFAEMHHSGFKPDEVTYNCMINAAVSAGHVRLAWDTATSMEKAGVQIDRFTVSILLKTLKGQCAPRDVKSAMALVDRIGYDACTGDEVLLKGALETCAKHDELRRLQNLVSAWERSSLQPSIHTYAALIKAYGALKRVDRCQQLWRQMTEERGIEPSEIVFGCMLDTLACNGMVTEAVVLFKEWKARVGANMIIYSTLMKGFAAAGRAQDAMKLWYEVRMEEAAKSVVVYNALIDAQARAGAMGRAHELLIAMEEDGVAPDGITHGTMLKAYCTIGDLDKAFEIFRGMQKAGWASDCIVYNTLLDSCTKHNRVDMADRVLADFERNCVRASNFTLGILVKMYGRRRQLGKAFDVLGDFAAQHKLTPNIQVRACLMSVCINNGALDRALELFEAIKRDSEGQVNSKTCDNVLSGLMRAGRLQHCVRFVEEAYGLGDIETRLLPPGHNLAASGLERLMKGLQSKGMEEERASLHCRLTCQRRLAERPATGPHLGRPVDTRT